MAEPTPAFDFSQFAGYSTPNTTQIPDEFLDYQMAFLSGAEVKVMLYIFRRTLGFKRHSDNISLNQLLGGIVKRDGVRLDNGTGLSKSTLLGALKSLVEKRLILIEQRQSDDRGNEPSTYRLNFQTPLDRFSVQGGSENHTPLVLKNDLGLVPKIDPPLVPKIDPTIYSSTTNSEATDNNNNTRATATPEAAVAAVVVALLTAHGIGKGVAQTLAAAHPEALIREKVTFLEFLRQERPGEVQKPAAWLRRAIEDDFGAPDGFLSELELQTQEAELQRQEEAFLAAQQQTEARAQARRDAERAQKEERQRKLREQYPSQPADVALWQAVQGQLQHRNEQATAALLLDSEVLGRENGRLRIGVWREADFRALSHQRVQALLKRCAKVVAKEEVEVEFVLVDS